MKLKAQTTKERLDKLETIKIESFWAKDTISGLRRHPTEWEKMFVNHRFDKGLISRIYKELLQLNNNDKKNPNPIGNG